MAEETIAGGRELDDFLKTFSAKVEKNIMRAALRAGAAEFREQVRANVPVASGDLKRSIRITTRFKKGTVYASVKAGGKRAPHWHFVEFGTAAHRIAPKGAGGLLIGGQVVGAADHPGARPKPFMRPAFDTRSAAALKAVAAKIRERLTAEGINVPAPEGE